MTTPAPATARRAVSRRPRHTGLDGGTLPVRAWLLLAGRGGVPGAAPDRGRGPGDGRVVAQDPSGGYPPGARAGAVTVHGQLHALFAMITITALAAGCFVLAARFAAEPGWRCWAAVEAAAGVAA